MNKPIYLFHGEDSFSSQQKASLWKDEFIKKYDDMNIQILEGNDLTAAQVTEAINTVPFLGEKKLIIIRDFLKESSTEEQKLVADKLEEIPDYSVLVFTERGRADSRLSLFKRINKDGQTIEFNYLEKYDLLRWIQKEVEKKGCNINGANAGLLADTVGPNLWQMSQEIEKLTTHAGGKEITAEAIESLTTPNLSESIFKLTDYLAQRNQKRSLDTFNNLLQSGEDMMQILFMIVRHFRILIQIKACEDKGMSAPAIAKKIGEHPYAVKTAMSQVRNFTPETLSRIYRILLQIDSDLKGGRIHISTDEKNELRLAIEKFIVEMST